MTMIAKLKRRFYFIAAAYFRFFANFSLRRWQPRIIIVTGSVGKTTMLNLIESQLGGKAHYSHNANSAFGIAFDILGMTGVTASKLKWIQLILASPWRALKAHHHEAFYVVECDGERPREASTIAKWLRPELCIWVSIGRSHAFYFEKEVRSGKFKDIDTAIAHEFASVARYTRKQVFIDGDNPLMLKLTKDITAERHALSARAVSAYQVSPRAAKFRIGKHDYHFNQPLPRAISIQLVMLDALLSYLDIRPDYDFKHFKMPPSRGNYLRGINNIEIIDSSYNAHLISMRSMLQLMQDIKHPHKWLILGDMIEQGSYASIEHRKLADDILKLKPEQVVLVGRRLSKYTFPALKGKLPVASFDDPRAALDFIKRQHRGGELMLFKGSQYLEWIIAQLLASPSEQKLLCRQDPAHVKRRKSWGLE